MLDGGVRTRCRAAGTIFFVSRDGSVKKNRIGSNSFTLESLPVAEKAAANFRELAKRIESCEVCLRLRITGGLRGCDGAHADQIYWGKPGPSFGDPEARVLALGLAPGAHGSNRTGRPFTGEGSGNFLYPVSLRQVSRRSRSQRRAKTGCG